MLQAAERAELKRKERMRKEGEELSEVCHMMTSDILTECPEAAQREAGGRGGPRILTDRWRGMSGVQLSAIYRQREEQRAEKEVVHTAGLHSLGFRISPKQSIYVYKLVLSND